MGTRTSRLLAPIQVHQHHHEERTTTPGEPHGGCPEHGPKHGSQHDAEQWHAEPTVQEPEQVPAAISANNFHHQGRNDMNYNMMNGQNFQGQKYRENMQSNNMPYDQVMNTVSMMKF